VKTLFLLLVMKILYINILVLLDPGTSGSSGVSGLVEHQVVGFKGC
jgi:preprotein translocase subunit SecG